ncbi:MAG TPA: tetraacyldisaccharide 4'-kinase [Terriglobales bacterium]|nr:tetraacyldisaccharide 4'-kinase [Terriglobales bacterium]
MIGASLYRSVVALRNYCFDREILRARGLSWPVISVGNISVGGSGKTPFVVMLGELLKQRGIEVDVLSRGYRRTTTGVLRVDPDGTPEQFGDEPLLIARKLGCPVFVGEDRFDAGLEAEETIGAAQANRVHLLDDGFQHRQLHRDLDIVLLNQEVLSDKLLPLGRLREPLSALQRADVVVVDQDFPQDQLPRGEFQVWRIERNVMVPEFDRPVIAFCGIARPQRFFYALRKSGMDVREEIVFRDHHRYTSDDVARLNAALARHPGSQLITTEKDAVNLGTHAAELNPLVVPLETGLIQAETAIAFMLTAISDRKKGA